MSVAALKKIVTDQKVLTNTFCKILNCLFFMFLFTSCAHKQSVAKIIRATTQLPLPQSDIAFYIVISKTVHISIVIVVISKTVHISKFFH